MACGAGTTPSLRDLFRRRRNRIAPPKLEDAVSVCMAIGVAVKAQKESKKGKRMCKEERSLLAWARFARCLNAAALQEIWHHKGQRTQRWSLLRWNLGGIEFLRVRAPLSNQALVQGDFIRDEFCDTRYAKSIEKVVKSSTEVGRDFIGKSPIFFFGLSRQGKSTLINDLMQQLGSPERPFKEGFMESCTRQVEMGHHRVNSLMTKGVDDEVILFDTPGWDFAKQVDVASQCCRQANEAHIPRDLLKNRLVLVLVVQSESRGTINDERFLKLVRDTCKDFASKAGLPREIKPVLLPVLSKTDLLRGGDECSQILQHLKDTMQKEVSSVADIEEAVVYTHEGPGRAPSQHRLLKALVEISRRQLTSEHITSHVRQLIGDKLRQDLVKLEAQGLEHRSVLVRRFLWSCAKMEGLCINGLEAFSDADWEFADRVRKQMATWLLRAGATKEFPHPSYAELNTHDDGLRRLWKTGETVAL